MAIDPVFLGTQSNDGTGDHPRTAFAKLNANIADLDGRLAAAVSVGLRQVGTQPGTLAAGDDARFVGAAQKAANLSDLPNAASARANLGLGNVDNTADVNKPVSTAQAAAINTAVANLVGAAPSTLDTLKEIADQLATDESAVGALTTTVGGKLAKASNLSDLADAPTARTNLGLGTAATAQVGTGSNQVVQLDGNAKLPVVDGSQLTALPLGAYRYALVFFTPGTSTWSAPKAISSGRITVIGGGGGGGGSKSSTATPGGAAGGGAGGISIKNFSCASGASFTLVVGAGAAQRTITAAATQITGFNGNTSTATCAAISLAMTASAGVGGSGFYNVTGTISGGAGGGASGGDINLTGGAGTTVVANGFGIVAGGGGATNVRLLASPPQMGTLSGTAASGFVAVAGGGAGVGVQGASNLAQATGFGFGGGGSGGTTGSTIGGADTFGLSPASAGNGAVGLSPNAGIFSVSGTGGGGISTNTFGAGYFGGPGGGGGGFALTAATSHQTAGSGGMFGGGGSCACIGFSGVGGAGGLGGGGGGGAITASDATANIVGGGAGGNGFILIEFN